MRDSDVTTCVLGAVRSVLSVLNKSLEYDCDEMRNLLTYNPLRKHAHMIYSNFFMAKINNFHRNFFDIFLIFAKNIDCGYTLEPPRRGGSNEYPQSMFWSKNKKNRYTPANPSFTIKNWGLEGYSLHGHVFLML